jgi:hypothetical protein
MGEGGWERGGRKGEVSIGKGGKEGEINQTREDGGTESIFFSGRRREREKGKKKNIYSSKRHIF